MFTFNAFFTILPLEILTRARYFPNVIREVLRKADQRKMYTRYYNEHTTAGKQNKRYPKRTVAGNVTPKAVAVEDSVFGTETPCLSETDLLEEPNLPTDCVELKNLFLMELPDNSILILYPNGKKAISRTSTGQGFAKNS